jgi:hypothetical protein
MTHKERSLCFHPKDADVFLAALRERWPRLTIWPTDAGGEIVSKHGSKDGRAVPECESFNDAPDGVCVVFVKPEGWRPRWKRSAYRPEWDCLDNLPPQTFRYRPTRFHSKNTYTGIKANRPIDMCGGEVYARYPRDDAEARRFAAAVWRIIADISTRDVDVLSLENGMLWYSGNWHYWCGYHALDWCRRSPHRTLCANSRPHGSTQEPVKYLIATPRSTVLHDGTPITLDRYLGGLESGWLKHIPGGGIRRVPGDEQEKNKRALRAKRARDRAK